MGLGSLQLRALSITAALSACTATPMNLPLAAQVDGGRGFGARGFMRYSGDPEVTKQRIKKNFEQACGGPVEMKDVTLTRADAAVGIKYYSYDATAKCLPK